MELIGIDTLACLDLLERGPEDVVQRVELAVIKIVVARGKDDVEFRAVREARRGFTDEATVFNADSKRLGHGCIVADLTRVCSGPSDPARHDVGCRTCQTARPFLREASFAAVAPPSPEAFDPCGDIAAPRSLSEEALEFRKGFVATLLRAEHVDAEEAHSGVDHPPHCAACIGAYHRWITERAIFSQRGSISLNCW